MFAWMALIGDPTYKHLSKGVKGPTQLEGKECGPQCFEVRGICELLLTGLITLLIMIRLTGLMQISPGICVKYKYYVQ